MPLNAIRRFYFTAGAPLIFAGITAGWHGTTRVAYFLRAASAEEGGLSYDSKELILPYFSLFMGLGCFVFGAIYITKGIAAARKLSK